MWPVAIAAVGYVFFECWIHRHDLAPALPYVAGLALPAALIARIAGAVRGGQPGRLSLTFILVALLVLPSPSGLVVALVAALAGGGAGIVGISRRGAAPVAAIVLSVSMAQYYRVTLLPPADTASGDSFVQLLQLFILIQGCAFAFMSVLGATAREAWPPADRVSPRLLLLEGVSVILAWVLCSLLSRPDWLPAAALSAILVLGAYGLRTLDHALRDLRTTNDALAARVTELAILHSIGREILSSLDPAQVFAIIERECRKIFDVDFFFIALADAQTSELRVVFRGKSSGGTPRGIAHPLDENGLSSWVLAEKRGVRIDDVLEEHRRIPFRFQTVDTEIRSVLATPLVVEEKVIGVLSVQSRRPRAYDDHLLSVLTTIAQQAAVAIENARHYEMATIDTLTGMFLRDYFFRRLQEEYNRARRYDGRFALLMLDLDGFKEINDRHGHLAGDRYLREFAAAVNRRLRAADLACRYGGDEFCLLLPETDLAGATVIAERVRSAVSRLRVEAEGIPLHTTVSIGLAVHPDHDSGDLKGLLFKADQALYQAKRAGRDRVVLFAA